jgi:hypothetical protein
MQRKGDTECGRRREAVSGKHRDASPAASWSRPGLACVVYSALLPRVKILPHSQSHITVLDTLSCHQTGLGVTRPNLLPPKHPISGKGSILPLTPPESPTLSSPFPMWPHKPLQDFTTISFSLFWPHQASPGHHCLFSRMLATAP